MRQKLNNLLREQGKTLFLHRKPKRNAHFWTCQFKSALHAVVVPVINSGDI